MALRLICERPPRWDGLSIVSHLQRDLCAAGLHRRGQAHAMRLKRRWTMRHWTTSFRFVDAEPINRGFAQLVNTCRVGNASPWLEWIFIPRCVTGCLLSLLPLLMLSLGWDVRSASAGSDQVGSACYQPQSKSPRRRGSSKLLNPRSTGSPPSRGFRRRVST